MRRLTLTGPEIRSTPGGAIADPVWPPRVAVAAILAVLAWIGGQQTLRSWRSINADGVSYLDLGTRLLASRMADGYSGYWSPLYAVLAAAAASVAERCGMDRLAGVQALNFGLFVAALAACVWMVRELAASAGGDAEGWRAAVLQVAGASLLCFLVVGQNGLSLVAPDILVAALIMAAAAVTARMMARGWTMDLGAAAGLIHGAGYWAKAIFFPLWWWWLILVAVFGWKQRGWWRTAGAAVAAWVVCAGPLLYFTSRAVGRFSFGEAARLNVLWEVNRVSPHGFWEGREEGFGQPVHPLRKAWEHPAVYVFGDEFPGATYPIWYAPAFWYEGALARIKVDELLAALDENTSRLKELRGLPLLAAFFALGAVGWAFATEQGAWKPRLAVLLYSLGCSGLLLVVAEPRYFFGNVSAAWAAGAAGLAAFRRRWRRWSACWAIAGLGAAGAFAGAQAWTAARSSSPSWVVAVADELRSAGVPERANFCWIGPVAGTGEIAWQLRSRVVAQMTDAVYRAWTREHGNLPAEAEQAFRAAGCSVAVALLSENDAAPPGWRRAGKWPVYVHMLNNGGK